MDTIDKIKNIILDNNWFDTVAGLRFKEWNQLKEVSAVISFSGRSKKQECYRLSSSSDSDSVYVTHLYMDRWGDIKVQLGSEDTDEINMMLHPSGEPIENFDEETLQEWVELLNW